LIAKFISDLVKKYILLNETDPKDLEILDHMKDVHDPSLVVDFKLSST
jgi:hypothetical protein